MSQPIRLRKWCVKLKAFKQSSLWNALISFFQIQCEYCSLSKGESKWEKDYSWIISLFGISLFSHIWNKIRFQWFTNIIQMSTWLLNYFWKWTLSHYIHLCVLGFLSRWFSCELVCHSISLSILEIVEFCRNRKKNRTYYLPPQGWQDRARPCLAFAK